MTNPTRNPTNKSGMFLTIPLNQEGAQPRLVTEDESLPASIVVGGHQLSAYYNAVTDQYVLNTHDADVHGIPINQLFHRHTGVISTLVTPTASDGSTYEIELASVVGFVIDDFIQIGSDANHSGHKPQITNIVDNTLTLNARIDQGWPAGTQIEVVDVNMNVAGTMAAPVEFVIKPNGNQVVHITRILPTMTHGTAGDLGLFGNLAKLLNGCVMRAFVNGQYGTFTNWKDNAEIKLDMFDLDFDTRSGGGGTFGTSGRGSFDKIKVAVRLDGAKGDFMEFYVQDATLVGLDLFRMKAQGHVEGS